MSIPASFEDLTNDLNEVLELSLLQATRNRQFSSLCERRAYQSELRGLAIDWLREKWLIGALQGKQFRNAEAWFATGFRRLFQEYQAS